ncbi:MAG: glycosyltransferase family 2 protein [Pseudomonadota bacterium]
MSAAIPVSVVVVSRDRPDALKRCLTGISQLRYPAFEVVLVSDADGLASAQSLPFAGDLKLVRFDQANISCARNLGISHAAGDVVAFIDDDAVPEPSWLTHLVAPFARDDVASSGGFVRARNGISFQYKARSVDTRGHFTHLDRSDDSCTVLTPKTGRAVKTEGTNMAVRRDALIALEGFDPAFAFFLDETDLNLRLARAGLATAIAPLAQVHHGFAASRHRRPDRVPRDLFDIGASWAVFQRKHLPQAHRSDHWRTLRSGERKRLIGHMVAGRLEPRDVKRLLQRLDQGYTQGLERKRGGAELAKSPIQAFRPMPMATGESRFFAGRIWQNSQLWAQARATVEAGGIATVLSLSPTTLYHQHSFLDEGFWLQSGGLWGRSERSEPLIQATTFSRRVKREQARLAEIRLISGRLLSP